MGQIINLITQGCLQIPAHQIKRLITIISIIIMIKLLIVYLNPSRFQIEFTTLLYTFLMYIFDLCVTVERSGG